MALFIIGLLVGMFVGVGAILLVSVNKEDDYTAGWNDCIDQMKEAKDEGAVTR